MTCYSTIIYSISFRAAGSWQRTAPPPVALSGRLWPTDNHHHHESRSWKCEHPSWQTDRWECMAGGHHQYGSWGEEECWTCLLWVFLWQCLSWLLWGVRTKQSASILPQKLFALRGPGIRPVTMRGEKTQWGGEDGRKRETGAGKEKMHVFTQLSIWEPLKRF